MATLTSDITADQTVIGVTGSSRTTGHYRFRIDDELMDLQGFPKYELRGGYRQPGVDHSRWIVTRGVGGSTKATHSAGDTIKGVTSALVSSESETPPAPWAGEGGGGGVTVDNQDDPPATVTTLIAPGATIAGDEATLPTSLTIYQASVTLTDAQIKALPTTPVALVPAPGATELLAPIAAWLYVDWVADYTNIGDTGRIGIAHIGTFAPVLAQWTNDGSLSELFNLLADGASHVAFAGLEARGTGGSTIGGVGQFVDEPGIVGAGLEIFAGNSGSATGNFTGGNAGNSIKVTIWYGIVDVA